MNRRFVVLVTLLGISISPIQIESADQRTKEPAPEVFVRDNEVFLRRASSVVQLTKDGKLKHNVLLAPGSQWVIYHGDPIWDDDTPAAVRLIFTVIKLKDFTQKEISFYTPVEATIKQVEYLTSGRFGVLASLEGRADYYYLLDADQGKEIENILGRTPTVSPDRSKIAYLEIIPHSFPAELTSDFVSVVDLTAGEDQIKQQIHGSVSTYPERDVNKRFSDLADRHFVKSNLLWSSASNSLAFIENHQKTYWAVVLDLAPQGMIRVSRVRRFKLATEEEMRLHQVENLNWDREERLVTVATKGLWDSVNQIERIGPKIEWQIDLRAGDVSVREINEPKN